MQWLMAFLLFLFLFVLDIVGIYCRGSFEIEVLELSVKEGELKRNRTGPLASAQCYPGEFVG
jgi:hypothetical protein